MSTPSPDLSGEGVEAWFGRYLDVFAACGRGEAPAVALLEFYGTPLLLSTDDGLAALESPESVTGMVRRQVESMRSAGYEHSELLDAHTEVLNRACVSHRAAVSRLGQDGTELGRLTVTYLITGLGDRRRISALVVHSP